MKRFFYLLGKFFRFIDPTMNWTYCDNCKRFSPEQHPIDYCPYC
jgi:hypothetical protein